MAEPDGLGRKLQVNSQKGTKLETELGKTKKDEIVNA